MVIPIVAYTLYDPTATLFSTTLDAARRSVNNNWIAVGGGAYQAKIIAPAINGVVVAAISILFAVLIENTITTLRNDNPTFNYPSTWKQRNCACCTPFWRVFQLVVKYSNINVAIMCCNTPPD
jgi:hypothetical protein